MKKIFIPIFIITAILLFANCKQPLCNNSEISVNVTFPNWPPDNDYPELDYWKVTIVSNENKYSYIVNSCKNQTTVKLTNDSLNAIFVQPIIKSAMPNFFCPAACVYPENFDCKNANASWDLFPFANIVAEFLTLVPSKEKITALNYFNWGKLNEGLAKKQNDSFTNFDSKKTKNCTTGFNVDMPLVIERILNPPQRFTIPYFETKCYLPSQIKNLNLQPTDNLLQNFIPLNFLYKEKGYLTIQTKPKDCKTAILLNNKNAFIQNKYYFDTFKIAP